MPELEDSHHHRSTTKVSHKPFKSRFTSRNALKEIAKGKVERLQRGSRKTPHQQVMSKFDRKNQSKQKRLSNNRSHVIANSVFMGKDGAPRIVSVVPLSDDVVASEAVRSLNASLEIDDVIQAGKTSQIRVERFKQKISYIPVERDLLAAMDACRVSDYVLFVLSAHQDVDGAGESMIRCIEGQGISQAYTVVQGLNQTTTQKKRSQVLVSLKSFIGRFFPDQEKIFSLDLPQECQNLIRSLCTTTPKGINWRDHRSWMLVEDVQWPEAEEERNADERSKPATVILTGVIRGKNLKANRLAQIGDWGEFQIDKIVAAPLESLRKSKAHLMEVYTDQSETVLDAPDADQDTLEDLAPEEAVMEDAIAEASSVAPSVRHGVLLDKEHHFSDDIVEVEDQTPRNLPKGTSDYQAAWFIGDVSDSGSDLEDMEDETEGDLAMNDATGPADGVAGDYAENATELGDMEASEYPQSEMFLDPSPEEEAEAAELAAYRSSRKSEIKDDLEFPDEVELHPKVHARERLARYRGLKSIRMSPWSLEEDAPYQPSEWNRLLEISDYKGAKSRVLQEVLVGGVKPGTRVHVHIRGVPLSFKQQQNSSRALGLFSLLRHEHKRTAVNFSFTLDSSYQGSLKSKEELIMQCGPRRFVINPLFSQPGVTPNDVHKFERYLHPGRTVVASFTAPLTWGSVPTLFFKIDNNGEPQPIHEMEMDNQRPQLTLIGRGSSFVPSTSRVIAKRIVLTGQPFKIHRRLVTVRYMFFNAQDVAWFKALPLWTNRGAQGAIKDSLGTHGYFKAVFDKKIGMMEAIGVSLYKRVWPRPARRWDRTISGDNLE